MNIEKLFNTEVMSLETYIMFRLKEQTAKLKDELIAKNRAPISLSMGAPTANPPEALLNRLKEIIDEDGIHMYSIPKGEPYFRKAIAQRMKNRFGVTLDPETEIFSLVGSKEGIANLVRFITTPKHEELEKDVIIKKQQKKILEYIKENGKITSRQTEELLEVKQRRARIVLVEMVNNGLLEKQGAYKTPVYVINNK